MAAEGNQCDSGLDFYCRNKTTALHLKGGALASIMVASALGVAIPLVGRNLRFLRTEGNFFFVAKAFAAGVILATGFVHILPDAEELLGNPCLPENPWSKFPWPGFIAMMSSLLTLVVDFVGTEYYERKHGVSATHHHGHGGGEVVGSAASGFDGSARINSEGEVADPFVGSEKVGGEGAIGSGGGEKGGMGDVESNINNYDHSHNGSSLGGEGPMHIVGMRAHAAAHSHSHADGQHGAAADQNSQVHHAGHQHVPKDVSAAEASLRHVVISQVLELGIVAHSVIIGLSLGTSESPCTIRPLMTALVFHQFFEGFALGGCISQAAFKNSSATVMALFFAFTTPFGICLGIGISSSYNENSPHALIVEGLLDAISAGILIYMALVDLIAADFLSKRLRCDRKLQLFSYLALFGGAGAMAALAIWA